MTKAKILGLLSLPILFSAVLLVGCVNALNGLLLISTVASRKP